MKVVAEAESENDEPMSDAEWDRRQKRIMRNLEMVSAQKLLASTQRQPPTPVASSSTPATSGIAKIAANLEQEVKELEAAQAALQRIAPKPNPYYAILNTELAKGAGQMLGGIGTEIMRDALTTWKLKQIERMHDKGINVSTQPPPGYQPQPQPIHPQPPQRQLPPNAFPQAPQRPQAPAQPTPIPPLVPPSKPRSVTLDISDDDKKVFDDVKNAQVNIRKDVNELSAVLAEIKKELVELKQTKTPNTTQDAKQSTSPVVKVSEPEVDNDNKENVDKETKEETENDE